ncbi:hypothetical protein V8G54_002051 [Vigna mungo]|uniref:RING-type E3 ubiquitin transferase n=1 Tax=Vigna mungo TaxID=3915 RepID=A0AAQ3SAG3_VIGMU
MFSNTPTPVVIRRDSTVIAVSGGRHSNGAVKWAVEHLLKKNSSCILLHVRTRTMLTPDNNNNNNNTNTNDPPKGARPPTEEELHQFFLPFRGFCARKGISTKELVLHDLDVTSALIAFVDDNCISTLVVGAATSSWGSILRRFNKDDVSATLAKSLPDTCSLYVISKGKVQHIRPSGHHAHHYHHQHVEATPAKSIKDIVNFLESDPLEQPHKDLNINQIAFEDIERKLIKDAVKHQSNNKLWDYLHEETNSPKGPIEYPPSQNSSANNTPGNSDSTGQSLGPSLTNRLNENQKIVLNAHHSRTNSHHSIRNISHHSRTNSHHYGNNSSIKDQVNFDMQMRKLKLELQKTAEMYGMACKEAVLATQKAMEIEKYRQEKERNIVEAKLAQSKMTMESTEMSKHLVKMDSLKRKEVELKAKSEEEETIKALQETLYNNIPYRRYTIEDIDAATNKFDNALKIGEGGYGPVFKGLLDHTTVAIKAVRPDLAYAEKQFQQETKPEPLVHRDLKPANILLDRNYVSKISDVGLARLVPPSVADQTTQYRLTGAAGTFCYIDPEYQQTGLLGVKSDVYSLGVVLLQIITGKSPMGLSHLVEKALLSNTLSEVLDPSVTDWPIEATSSFAKLALKCCELRKRDRPDLGNVVLPELNRISRLWDDENVYPLRNYHMA